MFTHKSSYKKICALVAQLVEQRTENPRVTGSIPVLGIWDISSVGRALDF